MTPVIPCSVNNISLIPGAADFNVRKFSCLTKCGSSRRTTKFASTSQRFGAPLRLFPQQYQKGLPLIKKYGAHIISATETDVAVEEADSPVADEASAEGSEVQSDAIKVESEAAPAQSKRTRAPRKSAMPPVKNEELIVGATFTGKVTSIQPFGAFVDIGAFKDGLVHVSRLSDKFVKDVGTIVSVGQEVKVKLVEADTETGRISLDMRDDDANKTNQKTDGPVATTDRPRSARRDAPRSSQRKDDVKSSKLVKGQELEGRVKNLTRSGAFISLPDGEEGFLPQSEEPLYEGIGNTSLQPDQEVKVRVLRVNRGKVTLTQKAETKDNADLNFTGEEYAAVNPFVLAFRKNKDIAAFLDQRGKVEKEVEAVEKVEAFSEKSETETDVANTEVVSILIDSQETKEAPPSVDVVQSVETSGSSGEIAEQVSVSENSVSDNVQIPIAEVSIPSAAPVEGIVDVSIPSAAPVEGIAEVSIPSAAPVEDASEPEIGILAASEEPEPQLTNSNGSTPKENVTEVLETAGAISPALVKQLREETGAGMMDCKKALAETAGDIVKAQEFLRKKGLASADKKASRVTAEGRIGSYIHDSRIGVLVEVNCETDFVSRGDIFKELVEDLAMQVAASPQVQYLATEDVPEEIINKEKEIEMQKEDLASKPEQIRAKMVEGRIRKRLEELALLEQPYIKNDKLVVKDMVKQTIATIGENIKVKRFVRYNLGEGLEKKSQDFAAEVAAQTTAKAVSAPEKVQSAPVEAEASIPKPPAAAVSAALVKQLREETGAGMMDCKKALSETGGDLEKAQEYLRVKGLSTADKKSSRLAAEGRIGAYIHDSRIGVLIEVNCETDFVGRSEKFKGLVDDLAMQVVACPQVQFVSMDEISPDVINKEKEIEMQREDLAGKPENIREKIVEGRVSKRLGELALLEQPFIKDDSILIKDLVKQTVAALGENIKVRRFVRFTLGETKDDVKTETATEG